MLGEGLWCDTRRKHPLALYLLIDQQPGFAPPDGIGQFGVQLHDRGGPTGDSGLVRAARIAGLRSCGLARAFLLDPLRPARQPRRAARIARHFRLVLPGAHPRELLAERVQTLAREAVPCSGLR